MKPFLLMERKDLWQMHVIDRRRFLVAAARVLALDEVKE